MISFDLADLDDVSAQVQERVRHVMKGGAHELVTRAYDDVRSSFNQEALVHCLEKYIRAEMDYETAGIRGIGRVADHLPRFAAYHRRRIASMAPESRDELSRTMLEILLTGYLTHALILELPQPRVPKLTDAEKIFRDWIPWIYGGYKKRLEPDAVTMLAITSEPTMQGFLRLLSKHGMHGFSKKTTNQSITGYYAIAGMALRTAELGEESYPWDDVLRG